MTDNEIDRAARRGWRAVALAEKQLRDSPVRAEVRRISLTSATVVSLLGAAVSLLVAYQAGVSGAREVVETRDVGTVRPVAFAGYTTDPGDIAEAQRLCGDTGGEFYPLGDDGRQPRGYVCLMAADPER